MGRKDLYPITTLKEFGIEFLVVGSVIMNLNLGNDRVGRRELSKVKTYNCILFVLEEFRITDILVIF